MDMLEQMLKYVPTPEEIQSLEQIKDQAGWTCSPRGVTAAGPPVCLGRPVSVRDVADSALSAAPQGHLLPAQSAMAMRVSNP